MSLRSDYRVDVWKFQCVHKLPAYLENWAQCLAKRVLIRFPLPYKLGESQCPGNVEEKLRCEAATFVWIKKNCPDIPIPGLWGFGFPSGQVVSCKMGALLSPWRHH